MQPTVSQAQSGPSAGALGHIRGTCWFQCPGRTELAQELIGLKESPVMKRHGMKRTRTRMHVLTHTRASACHTGNPSRLLAGPASVSQVTRYSNLQEGYAGPL